VAFAFGESGHQRQIDQALELVLEEQSGKNGEATGADDSPFEITASSGQPGLAERLKSARYSDGLLTLDVSMQEFVELQRLDDNGRRLLLGLPGHCIPGITAMLVPRSTVRRLVALIACPANLPRRPGRLLQAVAIILARANFEPNRPARDASELAARYHSRRP